MTQGRQDTFIRGGISINYQIQDWLTSSFSYTHSSFDSSLSESKTFGLTDFTVNTIGFRMAIGY